MLTEREAQQTSLTVENGRRIHLERGGGDVKTFNFDYVADEETGQQDMFETIARPIADACLEGYNGTIFAYGQTGSGKTFTIQGPTVSIKGEEQILSASNASEERYEMRGLMQRSFEYMFGLLDDQKKEAEESNAEFQYLVKSSYLEIYNEQIVDLLDPQQNTLHIREDIQKGVYVGGLQEESIASVKEMLAMVQRGARNRHVSATQMNKESSRSHAVLTTQIDSKCLNASGVWQMKSSRFHIIDLAGSERANSTQARGQRLKEASMINKSLTALGIVINSLVEISEGKQRHVHYRDSKLTFLLRDSLGGNSKTTICANVTAGSSSVGETTSTLMFAQRAKMIKNKAVINEESSGSIDILKADIRRLKKELAEETNLRMSLEAKLEGMPRLSTEGQQPRPTASGNVLCKICKAVTNIEEEKDNDSPFEMSDEESNSDEESKDTVPDSLSKDKPTVSKEFANAKRFLSVTSQNFLRSNTMRKDSNPQVVSMLKEKLIELGKMTERVVKVEKLLCETLENLDVQQKQYEQKIENLNQQLENKQIYLESFMKNVQMDKVVIRNRE